MVGVHFFEALNLSYWIRQRELIQNEVCCFCALVAFASILIYEALEIINPVRVSLSVCHYAKTVSDLQCQVQI